MKKHESDYLYEVWRNGGDYDAVDMDEIPEDFDWIRDEPLHKHLPFQDEEEEGFRPDRDK